MDEVGARSVAATAATGIGLLRVAVGAALAVTPASFLRWENPARAAGASAALLTRTVGIRDIALGFGTGLAARSGSGVDLRRWVGIGLLSDVLDVVAGAASARSNGKRGLVSALIPLPVILADLWVLSMLTADQDAG
jgi:hypothetical protein